VVLDVTNMDENLDVNVRIPDFGAASHDQPRGRERLVLPVTLDDPAVGRLDYWVDVGGGARDILTGSVQAA